MINKTVLVLLFSMLLAAGCNSVTPTSPDNTIRIRLHPGETYTYDTGLAGDEDGARIIQQAEYYEKSEIVRDSTTSWKAVFFYTPEAGFTGTDCVRIETRQGSLGAGTPAEIDTLKFCFIVAD